MRNVESPQCSYCVWYLDDKRCFGFRDGIPDEIFDGMVWHDEPYEGDDGYRFIARGPSFGCIKTECKGCGMELRIPVLESQFEKYGEEILKQVDSMHLLCDRCQKQEQGETYEERVTP